MTDILKIISPSHAFNLQTHASTTKAARTSFDKQVDGWAQFGADAFSAVGSVPKLAAKLAIGERAPAPLRPRIAHTKFTIDEGAIGNTLVGIQKVLAEIGAILGATAGILTAGGKTVIGRTTEGTVAAHAKVGKNLASLAATVVTSPASVALNWSRLVIEEALKILPAVGTVVGGAAGSVVGSLTAVLAGLGEILNISAVPTNA